MLLSKDAIQAITLNAKFVHKYADQAFFAGEIDNAPQHLKGQPFLNFFVRYHHRDAPERYSWSRVRRVVLLDDAIAAARSNGELPPCTTSTMDWRGKTIWLCFAVETVGEADGARTEELVMLPQLSNTVPEDDEVLAFCVASANRRPTEKYTDGVLGDVPAVLPDDMTTTAVAEAEASLNPRVFVPTARQVALLRDYKKQHFSQHQWVEAEIEASKALRQRYSSIGVAAAPVRTVAYEQEHRTVTRKQQQQQRAAPASPVSNLLADAEVVQDPLSQQPHPYTQRSMDGGVMGSSSSTGEEHNMTQTQQSTLSMVAPSSPSALSLTETPLSPFLPRNILRQQQQQQQQQQGGGASLYAARVASVDDPMSATAVLGGVSSTSSFSQLNVSQTPPPTQDVADATKEASADGNVALSQHLSQLRATQDSFYRYVSDERRSHYLNRLANITLRNSETNAQSRRRGIANERRLERKGNLLESRGLWITDDKERAKQAEDYVKTSASGMSESTKNEEKGASTNAVAGSGAGDASDKTRSAEEVFAEKFKAYHAAQKITFADCSDELLGEGDADVEAVLQAAVTSTSSVSGSGADGAVRASRRAVLRVQPNRLNTEATTPQSVQAQLVHRSTLRMAKRARDE